MKILETTDPAQKALICEKILRDLPDWFGIEAGIMEYIESVRGLRFWTASEDETEVGFVALKEATDSAIDIHVIGILEAFHRKSIGRKLIDTAVTYARNHGYAYLTVKTLSDKHSDPLYARTRHFYTAMGFRPIEYQNIWGPDNPCLMMAMSL